jgi:predicted MFS family arabinose efflux permease
LVQITSQSERNHAFAAQAALIAGLTFVGSMVAGWLPGQLANWLGSSLEDPAPYRYALFLAPVGYLLGAFAFVASTPVKEERKCEVRSATKPPLALFWIVGLVSFLGAAADGGVRAFFNVYLDTQLAIPTLQIGAIMGVGQFVPIFVALLTPAILTRWGATRTIALALFVMGMAIVPLAIIPLWQVTAVCFMAVLCMISLREPARKLFSQEIVSPQWGTTSSAINTIGGALGWAIMSAAGGYLIPLTGFQGLFVIAGVMALGASGLLLSHLRMQAPQAEMVGAD